ncbi:hypothetical protein CLV63_11055 [Murinocardiopsis flavida]|uniref:Uncharacterized protein n=1 Tax=Murinocardiopsis flavida TaxID=645275 RepID=A0A2P8DHS6_9ACTN|nr:hypothetical protein CLV63_11055 [Murinocardiopsis flavida]
MTPPEPGASPKPGTTPEPGTPSDRGASPEPEARTAVGPPGGHSIGVPRGPLLRDTPRSGRGTCVTPRSGRGRCVRSDMPRLSRQESEQSAPGLASRAETVRERGRPRKGHPGASIWRRYRLGAGASRSKAAPEHERSGELASRGEGVIDPKEQEPCPGPLWERTLSASTPLCAGPRSTLEVNGIGAAHSATVPLRHRIPGGGPLPSRARGRREHPSAVFRAAGCSALPTAPASRSIAQRGPAAAGHLRRPAGPRERLRVPRAVVSRRTHAASSLRLPTSGGRCEQ